MLGSLVSFVLEHWTWLAPSITAPLALFTPAGPLLAFVKANWKWLLPCLIAAVAVVYAGTQRINYLECKAERAEGIARAEKAARDFAAKDLEHANRLVGEYAGEVAELQGKYQNAQINLARVQSTAACRDTPAARAFDDGVQRMERQAGDRDAGAAGDAGAAVPAPAGDAGGGLRR
ncbi:MAG: hypothetical protein K9G48_08660 [Reyranella sp.]|nr:hypothetical protein [Reyranella sp.]